VIYNESWGLKDNTFTVVDKKYKSHLTYHQF